tara:strand:- start:323 stop:472 length:150 start_codon:yes stop_codon:yes gene_type:complete
MEILAYLIVGFAALGLTANFLAIFCVEANDRLNEEYLEMEKAKLVKYGP